MRGDRAGATPIAYRTLRRPEEMRAANALQMEIWGMAPEDTIPWSQILVTAHAGGVVLGAFAGRTLVGFLYSFPGWDGRVPFLYSKMLGVRASHRARAVGRRLKRLQRREALRVGYDRVVWTFDPLERAAARLNAGHLGVIVREYRTNFYGAGGIGRLHAGLRSDRLFAEWEIRSERVARRQRRRRLPAPPPGANVLLGVDDRSGEVKPGTGPLRFPALVAVPENIQILKRDRPRSAARWQQAMRRALGRAFQAGGVISDLAREERDGAGIEYYVVTRSTRPSLRERGSAR